MLLQEDLNCYLHKIFSPMIRFISVKPGHAQGTYKCFAHQPIIMLNKYTLWVSYNSHVTNSLLSMTTKLVKQQLSQCITKSACKHLLAEVSIKQFTFAHKAIELRLCKSQRLLMLILMTDLYCTGMNYYINLLNQQSYWSNIYQPLQEVK